MRSEETKYFLVTLDPASGRTEVEHFDTDRDAAIDAYGKAERANGLLGPLDIVLLGSDSLESIKKTHSSYFPGGTRLEDPLRI
jgi:hypothetical protein